MHITGPKKILLAEDDRDDREVFTEFLHHRTDIQILPPVENGEELIRLLEAITHQPDMPGGIILDQNMPRLNGLQTLSILKKNDQYAHIPVMVYSTYVDDALTEKSKHLGAAIVMTKPSSPQGYNQLIDELLKVLF